MTHEHGEHIEVGGPEHDHTLPDADQVPGNLTSWESDLPPLTSDL